MGVRSLLVAASVAVVAIAGGAGFAWAQASGRTGDQPPPALAGEHDRMMEGNPEMAGEHDRMMEGNPEMAGEHDRMMGG